MQLRLQRPDDWHLHLRDGEALQSVLPYTARQFARAIVMPNLRPPVTTTAQALAYRQRILAALPKGNAFQPLMTLYLTDNMDPQEVIRAKKSGHVYAAKLYPAGATTNSDSGVTDMAKIDDVLAAMTAAGMLLLVHGEVTDSRVDIFDRESVFLKQILPGIIARHPKLSIVLEHITTQAAADFEQRTHQAEVSALIPNDSQIDRVRRSACIERHLRGAISKADESQLAAV